MVRTTAAWPTRYQPLRRLSTGACVSLRQFSHYQQTCVQTRYSSYHLALTCLDTTTLGIMDWQVRHSNTPYLADAFQQLVAFVEAQLLVHETPVLVAHNGISFDFPMLCSSLQPLRVPPSWTYLDTHTVCQCMKLKSVCALQNIKQGKVPCTQVLMHITLFKCFIAAMLSMFARLLT